jgi:hypothetical protein
VRGPHGRKKNNTYGVLVGNPEGKRPLTRPMYRLENDINMDWRVGTGFIWLKVRKSAHIIITLRVFKNGGDLLTD